MHYEHDCTTIVSEPSRENVAALSLWPLRLTPPVSQALDGAASFSIDVVGSSRFPKTMREMRKVRGCFQKKNSLFRQWRKKGKSSRYLLNDLKKRHSIYLSLSKSFRYFVTKYLWCADKNCHCDLWTYPNSYLKVTVCWWNFFSPVVRTCSPEFKNIFH